MKNRNVVEVHQFTMGMFHQYSTHIGFLNCSQVTGFLGSGKTTLLNHVLKQKGQRRVAVVENEVGEVNIDNSLVVENLISKEDLVSMDRGCVCCSLRHDIVKALGELQARGAANGVAYDNILLETTGLADPAPVAFTFFSNTWISTNFRLDSILCLVDAQHLARHLEDGGSHGDVNEAVNQIAFADIILLNKIDLVSAEELQQARDLVRSINVTADLIEVQLTAQGEEAESLPSWDRLMGINSFSIERALQVDPYFMDSDSDDENDNNNGRRESKRRRRSDSSDVPPTIVNGENGEHRIPTDSSLEAATAGGPAVAGTKQVQNGGAQDPELTELLARQQAEEAAGKLTGQRQPRRRRKKLHDVSGVGSVGITARGPLDKYRFNAYMRDLLSEKARDIFRSKGVLCIKGQEQTKFVFQGVHETVCFGPASSGWSEGEEAVNQIVFIGRNLNRKDLVEGLRSCVWVPLPDGWDEHHDKKSGQPYYVHSASGKKQWDRPAGAACALIKASESSHEQPSTMQPRKGHESEVTA